MTGIHEIWAVIEDAPLYSVSNFGKVKNNSSGKLLVPNVNKDGVVHVGLRVEGARKVRGVARLVATYFLPEPTGGITLSVAPMHQDNDRSNCHIDNLVWRPRWYVSKKTRQHLTGRGKYSFATRDMLTGDIYPSPWHAAEALGVLEEQIVRAVYNYPDFWVAGRQWGYADDHA